MQYKADEYNNNFASYIFIFGGEVVYPKEQMGRKDFVVKSPALLYLRETDENEYLTVCKAMTMLRNNPEVKTDCEDSHTADGQHLPK